MDTYSNGKIYKVYSKIGDVTYYGSTIQPLKKRIERHKTNYKNDGCYTSKLVLKYPDYKFEIVEYYSCKNKKQLERREGYYHRNFECVNKNVAGRTRKEYRDDHKEEIKKYYQNHKKEIKKYYQNHKKEKIEYSKQYHEKHKEKISEKRKIKITCCCGSIVRKSDKIKHEKSKKHIKYIDTLNITI